MSEAIRKSVTLYASFDDKVVGDRGKGGLQLRTRFGPPGKGPYRIEEGFDAKVFRIARDRGIRGGALEVVDVLPDSGRIFFPAKGNLAYAKDGWSGTVSLWLNTDPDKLLKTTFCDPIQITEKGANNGGIWFDFTNSKPRDMRLGVFPAAGEDGKTIAETDPDAPLYVVGSPGFREGKWHHVAITWSNLDTGKKDAHAIIYIDGKKIGEIKNRELAMRWNIDKAGIYVAVNYIGLLDELALFDRALTAVEVEALHREPGLLAEAK